MISLINLKAVLLEDWMTCFQISNDAKAKHTVDISIKNRHTLNKLLKLLLISFCTILVLATGLLFFAKDTPNSIDYIVKDKGYAITFPNQAVKKHHETYLSDLGTANSTEYDLNTQHTSDPNIAYKFTIYEYPEFDFSASDITAELLNETSLNLANVVAGERLYAKRIFINGYEGLESYITSAEKKFYITERSYLIEKKKYSIAVITTPENIANPQIHSFLNSFVQVSEK